MTSRIGIRNEVTLATVLPDARFSERHHRLLEAPPERVWASLASLRWSDLRISLPMIAIRAGGRARAVRAALLADGPVDEIESDVPRIWIGGRIGKPWQPRPEFIAGPLSLAEFVEFDEPGWLKYGMEFRLEPLSDGRTAVTTTTRCVATDPEADHRFARYWRVIRPFSGLVRRDMLAALARRAEHRGSATSGAARQRDQGDHA